MGREFAVRIEQDEEGWFVAEVDELPECQAQARTLQGVRERIVHAIQIHFEHRGRAPNVRFVADDRVVVS